jgi:hypothetical protein
MMRPTMSFAEALNHVKIRAVEYTRDNQLILVFPPNTIVKRKRWAMVLGDL